MEVIQLSGYILEEKMNIAKKYLVPQIMKDSGLQPVHRRGLDWIEKMNLHTLTARAGATFDRRIKSQ
jgi:ATP-dependent Lon protease